MQVTQYTYQSPYTSPVQFGRPDPSSQKEQENQMGQLLQNNESMQQARSVEATQSKEVRPTVTQSSLDIYA